MPFEESIEEISSEKQTLRKAPPAFPPLRRPPSAFQSPAEEDIFERQQKVFEFTRPLMYVLDLLQTGQYVSANVAKAILEGRWDIAQSAWRGLSQKEKSSFIDILKEHEVPYATAIGLALDIGLDPTTYLPHGLLTKPFKMLGEIEPIAKIAKKIKKAPAVKTLGKGFVPGYELPAKYYEKKILAKAGLGFKEKSALKELESLAQGLSEADRELLSFIRQNPERISELNPFQRNKLAEIAKSFENLGEEAVSEGVISREAFETWKDTYLPGYFPGKTKLAQGEIPPSIFEKVRKPTFAKPKKFKTLQEAEEYSRIFDRPDLTPEKDIIKLLGVRKIEQVRFLARKHFVDDVLREFGEKVPINEIKAVTDKGVILQKAGEPARFLEGMGVYYPKGQIRFFPLDYLSPSDLKTLKNNLDIIEGELIDHIMLNPRQIGAISGKVPAYLLPREIADDMNKVQKFFWGDEPTRKIVKYYDKILGAWKTMATALRLPFHIRNAMSNQFLIWLGGVNPINIPIRNAQALGVASGKAGFITTKAGNKISYSEIADLANSLGIRGRGWIGAEISTDMYKALNDMLNKGLTRKILEFPVEKSRQFGTAIEDNARLSLFIDQLIKGKTPEEARHQVAKYLFDYDELTSFEKNKMKRIFPFYAWMRKNSILQITSILEQPEKYALVGKALDALEKKFVETAEEKRLKPEYMIDMVYFKTPWKTKKGNPLYAYIDLPYTDLNRMFNLRDIISSVSPAKIIPEFVFNMRTFPKLGTKIESFKGRLVPAPFWVTWFPESVQRWLGMEPMYDPNDPSKLVIGMRAKWKHVLDNMFPLFSEMGRMFPQPVTLEEEKAPWRWKSYITGIKFAPLQLEERRKWQYIDQLKAIQEMRKRQSQIPRPLTLEEFKEYIQKRD